MRKWDAIQRIIDTGIVGIIRTPDTESAKQAAEGIIRAGITTVEISLTTPDGLNAIQSLRNCYPAALVGAGTVLDPETARLAILSGAQYIVTPYLNAETIKLCNRYQVACIPGAMTVKETAEAMEAGADLIKIFPAELFGPAIIKAIKGPLPQARLMPTGGVTPENVDQWISAGASAVGVGNGLLNAFQDGTLEAVCSSFINNIQSSRV